MKHITNIALLFIFISSYAQQTSIPQAINIVNKQAMLSQRMASEKIFQYNNSADEKSMRALSSSITQFSQNIDILEKLKTTPKAAIKIKTVKLLWCGYKETIVNNTENSYVNVMEYHDLMLNACKEIFVELMASSKEQNMYPYNTSDSEFPEIYTSSNNLKYLSQKLSLYYTAYYQKTVPYNGKKFSDVIAEIEENVASISLYKEKDFDIRDKTDDVEHQWESLKIILDTVIKDDYISTHSSPKSEMVTFECNKFLKKSDLLTRSYKAYTDINNN